MSYLTVLLNTEHAKEHFSCGNEMLDGYIHRQAKQDVKRKLAACFVICDTENRIKGYYTLSNSSIPRSVLPEPIIKKLPPSYNDLPVTLLGRLAVDTNFKGQGIGSLLLFDAMRRCFEISATSIASMAIVVDPIDDNAAKFYLRYGFTVLPGSGKMFIEMKMVEQLFSK